MSNYNIGPGSAPRKLAAIFCLVVVGIATPILLFRMLMGLTSMTTGVTLIVVGAVVVAGMVYLLRPRDMDDD